ncbi:MAG: GMP synthase subunit A [Methanobrevibacter sp.]|nr:GMP synthase subunit A [Methanobrevibacter sp.]
MQILVINNKGQYNHRIQRSLQYLKIPSELVSNQLSISEIEEKEPIGLILGGGPSIDGVGNAAEYIKHFDIPILGICLGHQLIAKTFGGEVATSDTESYAQVKININEENPLFKGLESPMDVWSSHKDEVHSLPEDFDIIAESSLCDIEAMKHKSREIYGIQFHPEVHHTPKGEIIFKNFYKICQNYNK